MTVRGNLGAGAWNGLEQTNLDVMQTVNFSVFLDNISLYLKALRFYRNRVPNSLSESMKLALYKRHVL